jgi:hypothetical protein
MADDLKKTGKPDDSRINANQAHEVNYWAKKWGVTAQQIRDAVKRVGSMVKDVKQSLGK